MKVAKKKGEGDFTLLDVTVSSAEVGDALNQAGMVFCGQMGLQPEQGKTPQEVASERLGIKNLDETVTMQAIELLVPAAINKSGIMPAFMPMAEPKTRLQRGHAFQFELNVLPKPSYELTSYEPVSMTIEPYLPDEAQIDQRISDMAMAYTTFEATDPKPLESGDSCLLKMETTKDGEPVPGLTAEQRSYSSGQDLMPPGFDEGIMGMEPGDTRTFTFEGPGLDADNNPIMEDYETTITLLEIQKEVVPVIDDAWVSANMPMFKGLQELRDMMAREIDRERMKYYEDYKRNMAASELSKRFEGSIPDEVYEGTMGETMKRLRQQVAQQGMTWEQFVEQNGGEQQVNMLMMVETRQQLVLGFSLDAYYREKGLVYTEEDLDEVCFQMAPQNPKMARENMEKNGFGYALRESAERLRACKDLVEHADITYQEPGEQGQPTVVA